MIVVDPVTKALHRRAADGNLSRGSGPREVLLSKGSELGVQVLDAETFETKRSIKLPKNVRGLSATPGTYELRMDKNAEHLLVMTASGTAELYHLKEHSSLYLFKDAYLTDLAWNEEAGLFAYCTESHWLTCRRPHTLLGEWVLRNWKGDIKLRGQMPRSGSVAFSPNGRLFAFTQAAVWQDGRTQVYDTQTFKMLHERTGRERWLRFLSSKLAVSHDGHVLRFWSMPDLRELAHQELKRYPVRFTGNDRRRMYDSYSWIGRVALSGNKRWIAICLGADTVLYAVKH